jgi:hypothetical protein
MYRSCYVQADSDDGSDFADIFISSSSIETEHLRMLI